MVNGYQSFVLDGNIGSGKTSVIDVLQKRAIKDTLCVPEPIGSYTNCADKNLLAEFYEGKAVAFQLQLNILMSNFREYEKNRPSQVESKKVIFERGIMSTRQVFAQQLFIDGFLTKVELRLIDDVIELTKQFDPQAKAAFFISTPSTVCMTRIAMRDRVGENNISLDYLESLDVLFKKCYLLPDKTFRGDCYVLDGLCSPEEIADKIQQVLLEKY
jgi:deoxyadenosine/deoxycytidine kinase